MVIGKVKPETPLDLLDTMKVRSSLKSHPLWVTLYDQTNFSIYSSYTRYKKVGVCLVSLSKITV